PERSIKPALQPVAPRESSAPPCRKPQPTNGQDRRCPLTSAPSYEPHGFEGLASVEVKGHPHDASVANGPHGTTRDADLDSHPSPTSEVADQNHRIITRVDHVFDLDPIALPRLQPVKPPGPQTLKADESHALSGYERRRNYLDVLVEERRESLHHRSSGRVVTKRCHQVGIPARLKAPDKLHVLLRHRLLPRRSKLLGNDASLVDVGVVRVADDLALYPLGDRRVPESDVPAAANWTA